MNLTKVEVAMLEDLIERIVNISGFAIKLTEYLQWLKYSKEQFNEEYELLNVFKIISGKLAMAEFKEVEDMIENILYKNKYNTYAYEYLIYGGFVKSQNDGDIHNISPKQVAELYGVEDKCCKLVYGFKDTMGINKKNYISLAPREDGDYNLYHRIEEWEKENGK